MADTTNKIKHVVSPLARQTLLDGELTGPVADKRPIQLLPWLQNGLVPGRLTAALRGQHGRIASAPRSMMERPPIFTT
jgi:hypothetical protein